jgi:type IV pilus assembly protein PilC
MSFIDYWESKIFKMPFFNYKAKNEHGETITGKVEARDTHQASQLLRSRQLIVVAVTKQGESIFSYFNKQLMGVSENDVVNFTRQLSTMITAGLSLNEALHILNQQSKPAMNSLIEELLRDVEGGKTFAQALEKHSKVFPRIYIQLVKAGETAGVLDEMLARLADNLEKAKDFRGKTRGALIYPAIVISALLIVAGIMMIFVIPQLTEMYDDFGAELPFLTQLLIDLSSFMVGYWWLLTSIFVGLGVIFRAWIRTRSGQLVFSGFVLRIPLYGSLRQKVIMTEFARTLSLLLTAGISLIQALEVATEAINSLLYREELASAKIKIEKGIPLGQAINNYELFPQILVQMISVGEETGKLDEVLMKLSVYFQTESEQAIKNLTTALEPMIMIVLGLGVGIMVVAIIMPIYDLTSQF